MDNKTAMMELYDKILPYTTNGKELLAVDVLTLIQEKYIPKERQQIEQAYNKGYTDAELEWTGSTQEDISQYSDAKIYYNQTYTQNNPN